MEGIKERADDKRGGGEAIILNISIKGGWLFEGRLLFEEIRYAKNKQWKRRQKGSTVYIEVK